MAQPERAEEALAIERQKLALILGSIGEGVITTDARGLIVLINARARELTGWSQEEAAGQPLQEVFLVIDDKTRKPAPDLLGPVLDKNRAAELAGQTALLARQGQKTLIAGRAAPLRDRNKRPVGAVLVFRDVTQRRRMKEELLAAQKVESVGHQALGLAHDLNNILTAVSRNLYLARTDQGSPQSQAGWLETAAKATTRAQDLIQHILTFCQGRAPLTQAASLTEIIRDSAAFSTRGSQVRCDINLPPDLWPVQVDQGQMSRVINNLILNADQAMPQGGVIDIRAQNVTLNEPNQLALKPGQYVAVSIKDQGPGIAWEDQAKIFEPFFSTKKQGSGLGLAAAHSIVAKHQGRLTVASEPGQGAVFHLYLPASLEALPASRNDQPETLTGQGKILVMDDEEMIRKVLSDILSRLGYEVVTASDGAQAVELYRQGLASGKPFDAAIMDLTIPGGLGGQEAIKELAAMDPKVKAIVSSGSPNNPAMSSFRDHGFKGMVSKPFSLKDISRVLHQVLTEPDP
ncbi:MAG: response regulator [Deltaproteobacteria bacterium]|nr:response regulator [Deltaproteobacteria bacterium]